MNENGSAVASYGYDYKGRRVSKTVSGNTTKYCYDGGQVIAEYEDDVLVRKFIYGPGIDEPICMIEVDGETETKYYYHFDGLGSVVALSDGVGNVVERYSYDVFGDPNRTSSVGNPYMFTGRRYDSETALYYYRARYYKPAIGRFLQTDPIPALNLYTYCGNNPINWIDPSGLRVIIGPDGPHWWESSRPPSNFERGQINNVINDLKNTGDPILTRIADRLSSRTYVICLPSAEVAQVNAFG